jgi:hypothetical protein
VEVSGPADAGPADAEPILKTFKPREREREREREKVAVN